MCRGPHRQSLWAAATNDGRLKHGIAYGLSVRSVPMVIADAAWSVRSRFNDNLGQLPDGRSAPGSLTEMPFFRNERFQSVTHQSLDRYPRAANWQGSA